MKRNVLLLINGFGIEQSGSYNVYTSTLMPNLDVLTKERLFTSLPCKELDYKSGYRSFSIGIDKPLSYSIVESSINSLDYKNKSIVKTLASIKEGYSGKIHIFCFWENDKTIEHLLLFIKEIAEGKNIHVVVHLILCQKSLNDYKNMSAVMTRLNYEFGETLKVGIVSGENNLSKSMATKDIVRSLITDMGEKWKDTAKKFSVLTENRTAPCDARTFMVNEGYSLGEKDIIFFFNYNSVDLNQFRKEITNQKYKELNVDSIQYCSLFPVNCDTVIPFIYNFAVSSTCSLNFLNALGIKTLVLDTKERCTHINYYLTGLRNQANPNLNYLPTDDGFIYDKDKVAEIFTKYNHEFIILNYEIESSENLEEMKDRLKKIDDIIAVVCDIVQKSGGALFISSFYGVETELYNEKHELCKINFSTRVPLVVVDSFYSRRSDALLEGSLYDLAHTIYININPNHKGAKSLIRKKPNLLSIFYKKPKGGE